MNKKTFFIVVGSIMIIGLIAFFLTNKEEEKKPEPKPEAAIQTGVEFDEKERLQKTQVGEEIFSEKNRLELKQPEHPEIAKLNETLTATKENYQIEVSVYESNKRTNEGENKTFLVVFKNNGEKDFSQDFNFPCEYFLTVYENEQFLADKKDCKPEQKETLSIKAGEMFYFPLEKLFKEEERGKNIYMETPFGIFETQIDVE